MSEKNQIQKEIDNIKYDIDSKISEIMPQPSNPEDTLNEVNVSDEIEKLIEIKIKQYFQIGVEEQIDIKIKQYFQNLFGILSKI